MFIAMVGQKLNSMELKKKKWWSNSCGTQVKLFSIKVIILLLVKEEVSSGSSIALEIFDRKWNDLSAASIVEFEAPNQVLKAY